ncbi:MAG: hypothetical protein AAB663_00515 [Patescibacteria group bacterium]
MSKDGKTLGPDKCQVLKFRVDDTRTTEQRAVDAERSREATERVTEVTRLNNEATRKAELRRTVETMQDPGKILEAWKELRATHDSESIDREALRRIDMHLAVLDPTVIDTVARRDADAQDLVDTLNRFTRGNGEPEATPTIIRKYGFLGHLNEVSKRHGSELVETGANDRTRTEHLQARRGVEIATLATRMDDFLHALDEHVGQKLGAKLTTLEKASLNDHLTKILDGGHWAHPSQDEARAFAAWEKILGNAHRVDTMNIVPEPANFQPEHPAVRAGHALPTFKQKVPLLTNIMNAPGAAWREFLNLLPGDNKKR